MFDNNRNNDFNLDYLYNAPNETSVFKKEPQIQTIVNEREYLNYIPRNINILLKNINFQPCTYYYPINPYEYCKYLKRALIKLSNGKRYEQNAIHDVSFTDFTNLDNPSYEDKIIPLTLIKLFYKRQYAVLIIFKSSNYKRNEKIVSGSVVAMHIIDEMFCDFREFIKNSVITAIKYILSKGRRV